MQRILLWSIGFCFVMSTAVMASEQSLMCPIVSLQTVDKGYDAVLRCGNVDGLQAKSRVNHLFQRYLKDQRDALSYTADTMTFQQIGYLSSQAQFRFESSEHPDLQPGDLVSVSIESPQVPADQIMYQLSLLQIVFQEQSTEWLPWVQYRDYLQMPDYDFQGERMADMLAEIYFTAQYADDVAGTDLITGGRFEGVTLKEAMLATQASDLIDFFKFVNAFPGKYIGYTWKLPEVYATWVINQAPGPEDTNQNN